MKEMLKGKGVIGIITMIIGAILGGLISTLLGKFSNRSGKINKDGSINAKFKEKETVVNEETAAE